MQVLQLSLTELAGMPARLFRAQAAAGIRCRLITYSCGMFASDIVAPPPDVLRAQIAGADVVHVHGLDTYKTTHALLQHTPHLVHIHGDPDRQRGHPPPALHVVATPDLLERFPDALFVPNLILADELAPSAPLRQADALRVFKSPSLHDKHGALFSALLAPIKRRLGERLVYVAPPTLLAHRELIAMRRSCHISLDHLHGYYGLESLESLAQGLVAVNGASEQCLDALARVVGDRPPFAVARDAAEAGRLLLELAREALLDPDRFAARRAAGVRFMARRYSTRALLSRWLGIYRGLLGLLDGEIGARH